MPAKRPLSPVPSAEGDEGSKEGSVDDKVRTKVSCEVELLC